MSNNEYGKLKRLSASLIKPAITIVLALSSAMFLNQLIGLSSLKEVSAGFRESSESIYRQEYLQLILFSGVLTPVLEEIIFRGTIYSGIKRVSKHMFTDDFKQKISAALISSLLFGVYHLNLVQLIYAFIMGMLICLMYEYWKGIWGCFIFHISANLFVIACKDVKCLSTGEGMLLSIILSGVILFLSLDFVRRSMIDCMQ